MIERFARLPQALERQTRFDRLGETRVPALLAHPNWDPSSSGAGVPPVHGRDARTAVRPAPVMIWMHGRTVDKTLDPGRYLRWIRAGIAACALDLPGHGERIDREMHQTEQTLYVVERMLDELDGVIAALDESRFGGAFDTSRMGLGGMSAGGIVALRRLCDEHSFRCAAVEATVGDFSKVPYRERFPAELVDRLDPMKHLDSWRPIPLLALHSEADQWAPFEGMRSFIEALRDHYTAAGADPDLARLVAWPNTGAPHEHAGFGRHANEAKIRQVDFLTRWLDAGTIPSSGLSADSSA